MEKGLAMDHVTSIGLDVHARSITASAFNVMTGEVTTRKFGASPIDLAEWIPLGTATLRGHKLTTLHVFGAAWDGTPPVADPGEIAELMRDVDTTGKLVE